MKKKISLYQWDNAVIAVSEDNKYYNVAICGKKQTFNLILGMRLAALRLCADPLPNICNVASNANYIGAAEFRVDRSWINELHRNRGVYEATHNFTYGIACDEKLLYAAHTKLIFENHADPDFN